MNIKNFIKVVFATVFSTLSILSCVDKDDWNTPPFNCENRFAAPTMTMAQLIATVPTTGTLKIPNEAGSPEVIIDGYVVSSDENGNFYKTISFQDAPANPTAGLQIEVDKSANYADFPVGAHIRLRLNGLVIGLDRGTIKIGSVDPVYAIGRIPKSLLPRYISGVCNGNGLDIQTITPLALASLTDAKNPAYINMLVTVPNVQFPNSLLLPTPKTYIEYTNGIGADTDRAVEDATGGTTVIRNSSFVKYAKTQLPTGSGNLTFVVSRYNSSWQMLIRNTNDVAFSNPRFDSTPPKGGTEIVYLGSFTENFESYSPNNLEVFPKYWNDPVIGNRYWQLKTFGGNRYIQISAFSGTGDYHTNFMVPVDFTAANTMSFKVNYGFYSGGSPLKVFYTTNYTGDINTATLVDITSNFTMPTGPASGYGTLTSAGTYNIPASVTGNGFFVFKYEGGNPGITTTAQIDDIVVN